jgi:hypothetical protein
LLKSLAEHAPKLPGSHNHDLAAQAFGNLGKNGFLPLNERGESIWYFQRRHEVESGDA